MKGRYHVGRNASLKLKFAGRVHSNYTEWRSEQNVGKGGELTHCRISPLDRLTRQHNKPPVVLHKDWLHLHLRHIHRNLLLYRRLPECFRHVGEPRFKPALCQDQRIWLGKRAAGKVVAKPPVSLVWFRLAEDVFAFRGCFNQWQLAVFDGIKKEVVDKRRACKVLAWARCSQGV